MRVALGVAAFTLVACAHKPPPPPGDPLRPEAHRLPPVVQTHQRVPVTQPLPQAQKDCDPMDPNGGPPPRSNKERNIAEADAFAKQGLKLQVQSEDTTRTSNDIASLLEDAVAKYFTALAADPYNARATYNLAAAYARIGRNQCALNLLARMAEMRKIRSMRANVKRHTDRLFGRGHWKGRPDPDFDALRTQAKFRELAKDL